LPNPARNDVPDLVEPWQRPPRRAAPSPPSECGGILLILQISKRCATSRGLSVRRFPKRPLLSSRRPVHGEWQAD
jgi:hypothetical protein